MPIKPKEATPSRVETLIPPERDYRDYSLKPTVIDAATAHKEGIVVFENGEVFFRHPDLERLGRESKIQILPDRFHPGAVYASLLTLGNALSNLANSPQIRPGGLKLAGMPEIQEETTLRQMYDEEFKTYREMAEDSFTSKGKPPDYGTYVFDHLEERLTLIPPKFWWRLGLITSNSKLYTDFEGEMSWLEIRHKLEQTIVGVAGASVGGMLFSTWNRDACPEAVKLADLDNIESTNMPRGYGMDIRCLVESLAGTEDMENWQKFAGFSKAEWIARLEHLRDPYLEIFLYPGGITEENIPRFLFGDGKDEPPLDVLAEEVDLLPLKVRFREMCRKGNENGHRPDLLMVSDFGQMSIVQLKRYSQDPGLSLGYTISDERLHKIIFNKFNEDDSEKAGVLGESLEALFHNQITEGELTNILKLIKENGLEKAFGEIRSTYHGSIDRALETALEGAESGSREDMVEFIKLLCGSEALQDQFLGWLEQRGEQMCASLPQLPSIVRISSGIGVVHLINSLLGRPVPDRAIYDIQNIKAIEG